MAIRLEGSDGSPKLSTIFPGCTGYAPLGVVAGTDLPPDADPIFNDGFEGDTADNWSLTTP